MKIGIILDGSAETKAMNLILPKIPIKSSIQILPSLYADIQPKASPGQIGKSIESRVNICIKKGASQIIVLIDREDREECPGEWAKTLENNFRKKYSSIPIFVVIKNRKFENWLMAAISAFNDLPKRFELSQSFIRKIEPNKADSITDAEAEIHKVVKGNRVRKSIWGQEIAAKCDPDEMGRNSRSFRRFLRLLQHPDYMTQSKDPVNP
ncbi:MAG: DUF4276 family protein [Bacteroidia bacterium]